MSLLFGGRSLAPYIVGTGRDFRGYLGQYHLFSSFKKPFRIYLVKNICARAFEMRMPLRLLLHHLGQQSSLQFSDLQPVLVAPRAWLCSPRGRAVGDHVTMPERTSSRRPALLCPDPSPILVPTYFFQCHHLLLCLSCSPVISTCHSVVFPKDMVSSTLHVCVLLSDLEFLAPPLLLSWPHGASSAHLPYAA